MSDPGSETPPKAKPRKKRRLRFAQRFVLGFGSALVFLAMALLVLGYVLTTRPITAPGWLQSRIEARIAQELPQTRVTFGDMMLVVEDGLIPRIRLRDVEVKTPQGEEIVSLNEFKATFAPRPLLDGVVQPREIALSGIVATLKRDVDGGVSLSGGLSGQGLAREAATLPQLIEQLDQVLVSPSLSALTNVDVRAITLRYEDARISRFWTVDGARMKLTRDADDLSLTADLAVLGGGAEVATLTANYASRVGETSATFGVQFDGVAAADIAAQGPAFAWMEVLRAPISGAVRSGLEASGSIAPLNATLQIGAGVLQPNDQAQPIPFEGARSYFSYDPAAGLLQFDELSVQSKWVSGQASGTAALTGIGAGAGFEALVGQFTLSDLSANPLDLYPEPVSLSGADVDFQLRLDPFRVQLGRLQITDQSNTLAIKGGLQADTQGWQVALDGQMDAIAPDRLLDLWPDRLIPKTRGWLVENLLKGDIRNLDLALRLDPGAAPRTYVGFDYSDAEVRFLKKMPPIVDGKGHFSLLENRLVITLDGGRVVAPEGGQIDVTGSSFILPDVRIRGGPPAVVRLETASSVTSVLSLINLEPLKVMDRAGMPITLADGRARLSGTVSLPLRRGTTTQDVAYHFEGRLQDVTSETLVPNRALAAKALQVEVDTEKLVIAGQGTLDGVAFDGRFAQPIGAGSAQSTLRGEVVVNNEALDAFSIALPQGMVSGTGNAALELDFARGTPPAFRLSSDLRGLRVRVPQVSWNKPAGASGILQVAGTLGDAPQIDRLEVSGQGLSARGDVALRPGGGLDRVSFAQVQVGNWLDIPVDFVGRGPGNPVQVVLRGGNLDLRRAQFGGDGGSGGAGPAAPPMQVALDRLQITDTIALTNMRGQFNTTGGLDGTFEARLNGGAPVRGQVLPQNGRSAVRITSEDAGGVLRSAGILQQVVGGDMSLTLLPVGADDAFDGRVTAKAIRVKNAPGIAALLNAISVVGLVNELNGDGIYFEEVEGEFRLTSDQLTLTQSSAVGASMGLSMDGIYALQSGTINMQGVISPVYLLNGIGSILTRRGEGLIGFNYRLTGAAKDPSVSVNPLSALTPGMFREIFRARPPELPEVDGVTDSVLPEAAPPPRPPRDADNRENSSR